MIRLRKYRIFLAVTLCCFLAIYLLSKKSPQYSPDVFSGFGSWPSSQRSSDPQNDKPSTGVEPGSRFSPDEGDKKLETAPNFDFTVGHKTDDLPAVPKPAFAPIDQNDEAEDEDDDTEPDQITTTTTAETSTTATASIHWYSKSDSFPVPTESIIPLPTGAPNKIPRIQHVFASETTEQKNDRQEKLDKIKAAAKRHWEGYRRFAWLKDEVKPYSGSFRNNFGGWAATLVDSLDTLWIMGMKEEFEEAVKAAQSIDFTTAERDDIPMFETTIRYLGGFLGAYDVSGGKYSILLDKAKELAEVLIGAFDTPNRMPIMYFHWSGGRESNPTRASMGTVLAEIGSMSLEFTRLAQLTQDSKYYDAVARITNELQSAQNTTAVPGLWPLYVDASGCGAPIDDEEPESSSTEAKEKPKDTGNMKIKETYVVEEPTLTEEQKKQKDASSFGDADTKITSREIKRANSRKHKPTKVTDTYDCRPIGLQAPNRGEFAIGGQADSTYEYLPKEWLLLGGLNDQYRTMYKDATAAINDYLLFRAVNSEEKRKLLFTGKFSPNGSKSKTDGSGLIQGSLNPSVGHLTCFQGGMYALGAKIFERPDDLVKAQQLTDGCVWAYESSANGIMPEDMTLIKCQSVDECPWNQSEWWLKLDPEAASRPTEDDRQEEDDKLSLPEDTDSQKFDRRQVNKLENVKDATLLPREAQITTTTETTTVQRISERTASKNLEQETRVHAPTHAEFVQKKIANEGLWPGLRSVEADKYILRPEAIESVWYLYRITGEDYWREKGWKMFEAIEDKTRVPFGNSAIKNVVSGNLQITDEAESFWTAETLKYFYLLFSDPGTISLDDYVLNTEAHPLLRPDANK